jgi:hypothetical protein
MRLWWVVALAACGFHHGTATPGGDAASDSAHDSATGSADAALPDAMADLILIEAENYATKHDTVSNWSLQNSIAGYTGTGFMECGPGNGTFCPNDANLDNCAASMQYTFTIGVGATYYVHARMYAISASEDTIWYGIDNVPAPNAINVAQDSSWHWPDGAMAYPLAPGPHSLTVWQRECGAKIDALAITGGAAYP